MKICLILAVGFLSSQCTSTSHERTDSFRWLEDSNSAETTKWVSEKQNAIEMAILSSESYKLKVEREKRASQKLGKLPAVEIIGNYFYSLDYPTGNSKGVWKRYPIAKTKFTQLKSWEVVLDLDKLNRKENTSFTFFRANCTKPDGYLCLISLSDKGGDLIEVREFDTKKKKFLKSGFSFSPARTKVAYIDKNHVAISSDFGPGTTTKLGFGNQLRVAKRGGKLSNVRPTLSIPENYLTIYPSTFVSENKSITVAYRYYSESQKEPWIIDGVKKYRVPVPLGASVWGATKGRLFVSLSREWTIKEKVFRAGDLLGISIKTILKGTPLSLADIDLVFRNSEEEFLADQVLVTKDFVVASTIKDVTGRIAIFNISPKGSRRKNLKLSPDQSFKLVDSHYRTNSVIVKSESFLEPPQLLKLNLSGQKMLKLSEASSGFDSRGLITIQKWATSKDGTKVPYFVTGKKSVIRSGNAPTILKGYGSYGINQLPYYDPVYGRQWLEEGGLFAIANVRGGGELGINWYTAAVKKNKYKSIEDFVAVSRSLVTNKFTIPRKLGSYGGSMGGLLVAASMNLDPSLYEAVAVAVGVLDLGRGTTLIKGDWVGETGDPSDPDELGYVLKVAPLTNIRSGVPYPSFFAYSVANDSRVHPANSRKMVAKLESLTDSKTFYLEASEGGHSGASTKAQSRHWKSVMMEFFKRELGLSK